MISIHTPTAQTHAPVVQVMASELSARLKQAIDSSNVRHFEDDVQERLSLRKAPGGGAAATVADVMQVTYAVVGPLASLMPERVMMRYEQISTFLLKLKTMEFQLQQAWQVRGARAGHAAPLPVLGTLCPCLCWRGQVSHLRNSAVSHTARESAFGPTGIGSNDTEHRYFALRGAAGMQRHSAITHSCGMHRCATG